MPTTAPKIKRAASKPAAKTNRAAKKKRAANRNAKPAENRAAKTKAANITQSGFVALVGRPNVGKSTLLNCLSQKKMSIVSNKQQTTRGIIRSVINHNHVQMIWLDTPGWQNRHVDSFNQNLNESVEKTALGVDVIAYMIAADSWTESDAQLLARLPADKPVIALINKTDTLQNKNMVLKQIQELSERFAFTAIIPISARKKQGMEQIKTAICEHIPRSPQLFFDSAIDINFFFAELVRESAFRYLDNELPYALGVVVESEKTPRLLKANIRIYIEKESQKRIVIGKDGAQLKQIISTARRTMQAHLKRRIYAKTWVVVQPWRQNQTLLKKMHLN